MAKAFEIHMGEDRVLRGDRYACKSEETRGTVLIAHGYKGFKDWGMFGYAAERLSASFDVITFNFTHNGVGASLTEFDELEKFAHNTYSREQEDLDTLVRTVRTGSSPVFLIGHSRGGGNAVIYALDHPELVDGVVSWNGTTNVDLFTDEQKKDMRQTGRGYVLNGRTGQQMPLDVEILEDMESNRERFDLFGRIRDLRVPLALIQGTKDGAHLRRGSERLVGLRPDVPWIQIEGGDHTFGGKHPFQGTTQALEQALSETERVLLEWSGGR